MLRCRVNFYSSSLNKGIVKVVSTALFLFFGVETLGRKYPFFFSAMGMGTLFFITGAILKTHPPTPPNANITPPSPSPASKAMAAMLYLYVCVYSMGWGNDYHVMETVAYRLIIPVMQVLSVGSTSLTSSPPERDIMASHVQVHLSGFGVYFNIDFIYLYK